jgi:hypothetical protein
MSIESTGARLLDCAKVVLKDLVTNPFIKWEVALNQRELQVQITRDIDYLHYGKDLFLTKFSISWMPECPKVVIFHSVSVELTERNKGIGSTFHEIRLQIAKAFGATTALCTVNASNKVEKYILKKHGWQFAASVNPPNTELWSKQL